MTAVVSLRPNSGRPDAGAVIYAVAQRLQLEPKPGTDGTWEFCFGGTYSEAHAVVVQALDEVEPAWPEDITLEYALAV